MDSTVALEFVGPLFLTGDGRPLFADHPATRGPGVYLWTIPYSDEFLATYVGETGASFRGRIGQSVFDAIGGMDRVFDPDAMLRGERVELWPKNWGRDIRKSFSYLSHAEALLPIVRRSLESAALFVASFEGDTRLRRRIESAVVAGIDPHGRRLLQEDVRYARRRNDEAPLEVAIRCASRIRGLPGTVVA